MSIPSRDFPRVAWRRILREVRARTAPRRPRAISVGAPVQEIAEQLRYRQVPRFFGLIPEQAALIAQFFPEAAHLTLAQANNFVEHHFDVLGSGEAHLGHPIDWHTDFKSGHTWPLEHHTRLVLTSPSGGFDVKVPWELSRFHHAIRLGQAYLYTGDEIYAEEIVSQIDDWIGSNPYEFGVNWAGPMDVAIRAVNWVWAYYLIVESQALSTEFLALWLTSLRQHGEYLLKHLEDGWPRTNHLIANLTGLAYLGILFPEFPEAARWRSVGLGRLWYELERQVYADGMDYEASIPYHRLVTEMALSVAALCVVNDIGIPKTARARLGSMLDVVMAYTQPDGLAPQIGDMDDGRLLPLTVHADRAHMVSDHRYLLGLGSVVLERELSEWAGFIDPRQRGWAIAAGDEWQDAFWCFASDAAARFTDVITHTTRRPEGLNPDDWADVRPGVRVRVRALARRPITLADIAGSRGFEASGLYTMRHKDFHLVIDAGGIGQDGAGGHAHNDTLSLTLSAFGRTFLIDPGSYLYTSDPALRNMFRSTAFHNTLQINADEINRFPDGLFRLSRDARVTIHQWISQDTFDLFDASHNGYARLNPGVFHRRQVWFDKATGMWILHDRVQPVPRPESQPDDTAQAPHEDEADVTLWFHFAPLPVRLDRANNAVRTEVMPGPNLILLPLGNFPLEGDITTGWYAPRYGIKRKAPVAKFSGRVKLPADLIILLYPFQEQVDFKTVRSAGRAALVNMKRTLTPSSRAGLEG
jgi:hypothetical protein